MANGETTPSQTSRMLHKNIAEKRLRNFQALPTKHLLILPYMSLGNFDRLFTFRKYKETFTKTNNSIRTHTIVRDDSDLIRDALFIVDSLIVFDLKSFATIALVLFMINLS